MGSMGSMAVAPAVRSFRGGLKDPDGRRPVEGCQALARIHSWQVRHALLIYGASSRRGSRKGRCRCVSPCRGMGFAGTGRTWRCY